MKSTHTTLLAAAVAAAMVLSLSACSNTGGAGQSTMSSAMPAASSSAGNMMNNNMPASSAPPGMASTASMAMASTAAMPATGSSVAQYVASNQQAGDNWFGGPIYNGKPDLKATAALVKAGGGADNFSFKKALVSMLGEKTVNAEAAKLTKQYGKQMVDDYLNGMTFVVTDGLKRATEQGIKLPAVPSNMHGTKLAKALVKAGTAPNGTFWSGYLFDHMISHPLHNKVMADIDAKFGMAADGDTHKIDNQAMFDVAQKLGIKNVKLASFH